VPHRLVAGIASLGLAVAAALVAVPASRATAATPPTLAIGDVTVPEGDTGTTPARVTVRLSNSPTATAMIRVVTVGATATAGADFRAKSRKVRIRAGRTSAFITVPVIGDTLVEPPERIDVVITTAAGLRVPDGTGTVIVRDDEARVGATIGDVSVAEGDEGSGGVKVGVVLDRPSATDTLIGYRTIDAGASAPTDYHRRSGRIRLRAGRTTGAITVTVYGDVTREGDETFQVLLTGTGVGGPPVVDGVGVVTVRDDEPTVAPPPPPPPPPPTPDAPVGLTVMPGPTPRYLTATWEAPANGEPITGYDLEVTRAGTTNVVAGVISPYAFGCGLALVTDTCLVRARARNAFGDGAWTPIVTASTWTPPAAPVNLTVFPSGNTVAWEPGSSDLPIEAYEVQKQSFGDVAWTQVTLTSVTHAPTTCIFCSVRVRGQSDVGFGAWSMVAIAPPGTPAGLTATRDVANPELVHLTWSAPADPGSHSITEYTLEANTLPLPPTSSAGTDVFLRSTVTWTIRVYAHNLVGRSLFPATVTLPPG
jgi:hypothetical protein